MCPGSFHNIFDLCYCCTLSAGWAGASIFGWEESASPIERIGSTNASAACGFSATKRCEMGYVCLLFKVSCWCTILHIGYLICEKYSHISFIIFIVLATGLALLLEADRIEDLSRLFLLLARVHSLDRLKTAYASYIRVWTFVFHHTQFAFFLALPKIIWNGPCIFIVCEKPAFRKLDLRLSMTKKRIPLWLNCYWNLR